MKKYQKEDIFLSREDMSYRKPHKKFWRDKLDFSLYDMENFWDDTYGRVGRANEHFSS